MQPLFPENVEDSHRRRMAGHSRGDGRAGIEAIVRVDGNVLPPKRYDEKHGAAWRRLLYRLLLLLRSAPMPGMLAISLTTGICSICLVARILVVCAMARARHRGVYEGDGSTRDASKNEKSPPSPRRRMKKTKEDCFHGEYPTTRSLTRHEKPFRGTPLMTDQSKLLQLCGLKKPGPRSWSRKVAKD
jgi:hypothetical protein